MNSRIYIHNIFSTLICMNTYDFGHGGGYRLNRTELHPHLCVLTLSYSEQVAKLCGGSLGGWWLKALNLTQHEVIVSRQV